MYVCIECIYRTGGGGDGDLREGVGFCVHLEEILGHFIEDHIHAELSRRNGRDGHGVRRVAAVERRGPKGDGTRVLQN